MKPYTTPLNIFVNKLVQAAKRYEARVNTWRSTPNCEALQREIQTLSLEIRYLVHLVEALTGEIKKTGMMLAHSQPGSNNEQL